MVIQVREATSGFVCGMPGGVSKTQVTLDVRLPGESAQEGTHGIVGPAKWTLDHMQQARALGLHSLPEHHGRESLLRPRYVWDTPWEQQTSRPSFGAG